MIVKELFGMKKNELFTKKRVSLIIFYTLFAILINYLGSLLAEKIVFPLYLDSLLTISVVSICGFLPGLLCAFISNFILSLWTHSSMLFSVCHICTALFAWCVFKINKYKYTIDAFMWAGLCAAISNTFLGNMIVVIAFGSQPPMPQANIVVQGLYVAFENLSFANNFAGLIENLIDKLLSAMLSFCCYVVVKKMTSK